MKYQQLNKSYIFSIMLETDDQAWRAYIPELENKGASTWGSTKEEAMRNIQEVAQMVIEELIEDGKPFPKGVIVADGPVVAVTV